MSWRENWLLALPTPLRLLPPFLAACLGGLVLIWVQRYAPANYGSNLAPFIWCAIGVGLLFRPAQPLVISSASFGMAGLAGYGALCAAYRLHSPSAQTADLIRVVAWGVIAALAAPAAIGEALDRFPLIARRFYFASVGIFFVEQGMRRVLGVIGTPSEAFAFFAIAAVALLAVVIADRTLLGHSALVEETDSDEKALVPVIRAVRYLDETPLPEKPA